MGDMYKLKLLNENKTESPSPIQTMFLFFFLPLDIWASLCGMMYVSSLIL